jgi:hypothetical protein
MSIRRKRQSHLAWIMVMMCGALVVLAPVHADQDADNAARAIVADGCSVRCETDDAGVSIVCESDGRIIMRSPDAGLFDIGTDLVDGVWPATWTPGSGQRVEYVGDWLIVHGGVDTPQGRWEITDAYRAHGAVVKGIRRWTWRGEALSPPTVLTIKFDTPATGVGLVLPGVLYHGNPSGQASRAQGWNGLVPTWSGVQGERAYYQEHRYSAPYASMEWLDESTERMQFAALHSSPSYASGAVCDDLWWSLGVTGAKAGAQLACLSGPAALNDQPGLVKSGQRSATKLANTYIRIKPGGIVEKTFYLQAGITTRGSGFRAPLAASIDIHRPFSCAGFPTFKRIVHDKLRFAMSRWRADNPKPGFAMYPHDRNLYVMGWAGQSDAPGYALLQLADRLDRPEARDIAIATLEALSEAPFNEHGFQLALDGATGAWSRQDPISQGQAMSTFARAIRTARGQNLDTTRWDAFLTRACDIHAQRILKDDWRPASTNEGFLIAPLCHGAHESVWRGNVQARRAQGGRALRRPASHDGRAVLGRDPRRPVRGQGGRLGRVRRLPRRVRHDGRAVAGSTPPPTPATSRSPTP